MFTVLKARFLFLIPALAFLVYAGFHISHAEWMYWVGIYLFVALCNGLAAFGKLNYTVIVSGFAVLLFLITKDFPPIEKWGVATQEGREILGLIVCCNWMGFLGVVKLYNDAYK